MLYAKVRESGNELFMNNLQHAKEEERKHKENENCGE
jgi:hypothetical protein